MFDVVGRVEIRDGKIVAAYQSDQRIEDTSLVSETEATIATEDFEGRWDVKVINTGGCNPAVISFDKWNAVVRVTYFHGGYDRSCLRYREVLPVSEGGTLFLGHVSEARDATYFRPQRLNGVYENFYQEFGQKIDTSVAEFGPETLTKIYQKAEERDFRQRLNDLGITHTCSEIFGSYEHYWHVEPTDLKDYMIVVSNSNVCIEDGGQTFSDRKIYYTVSKSARWVVVAEYVDNGVCIMREVRLEAPRVTPGVLEDLEKFLDKHKMKTFLDLLDDGYYFVPADAYGRPLPAEDEG